MSDAPTEEQLVILDHDAEQHARILAGPGTGKSTTMVKLLENLLEKEPSLRVRMLTFTRAATAELTLKTGRDGIKAPPPSTIHSFAISILLRNLDAGGFPTPLRIADVWENREIVRATLAKRMAVSVSKVRDLFDEMAANFESLEEERSPSITDSERTRFQGAWHEHRQVLGYTLLSELPYALLGALREHDDLDGINFDLLLVDEYQDLNACDLALLQVISQKGGCSVIGTGDDDQSIYSWRKAAPEGIRRFPRDYRGAANYSLSISLRCGSRIIRWANHVIAGDPDRPGDRATLVARPEAADGEVGLLRFGSELSEAKGIADLVQGLIEKEGLAPRDILVLMRTDHNATFSNPLRRELEARNIECADPKFVLRVLDEEDNRRLLELLRLAVERDDSIAWASLLNLTAGVGQGFFEHIYGRAKAGGVTFSKQLLDDFDANFPEAPASARRARTFMKEVLEWLEALALPETPATRWGDWIVEQGGKGVLPAPSEDLRNLLIDLDGLIEEGLPLGRYLAQVEPAGKDLGHTRGHGVRLMNMGGSKGLTVRATIVAGVEHGLIPRPDQDLSEERRILYVAMTRAKEYCFCTWAQRRKGPTARAGHAVRGRRGVCEFLRGGPVDSQDGPSFLRARF